MGKTAWNSGRWLLLAALFLLAASAGAEPVSTTVAPAVTGPATPTTTPAPALPAPTPVAAPPADAAAPAPAPPAVSNPAEATSSTEGQTRTDVVKAPAAAERPATAKDSAGYDLMIRDLDEKVSDLKEKVFRSKARLILLKETVLHGSISGAKAILIHRNEMGSNFRLEQAIYSLDGAQIFQKQDKEGNLDEREEFEIFHGAIVPGHHNISVFLQYRGHGYGIFSYLEGYLFKIRSSFAFTAEEGKVVRIKTVGFEKGGITTDLKDKPSVRFDMEILKDEPTPSAASTAAPSGQAQPK